MQLSIKKIVIEFAFPEQTWADEGGKCLHHLFCKLILSLVSFFLSVIIIKTSEQVGKYLKSRVEWAPSSSNRSWLPCHVCPPEVTFDYSLDLTPFHLIILSSEWKVILWNNKTSFSLKRDLFPGYNYTFFFSDELCLFLTVKFRMKNKSNSKIIRMKPDDSYAYFSDALFSRVFFSCCFLSFCDGLSSASSSSLSFLSEARDLRRKHLRDFFHSLKDFSKFSQVILSSSLYLFPRDMMIWNPGLKSTSLHFIFFLFLLSF